MSSNRSGGNNGDTMVSNILFFIGVIIAFEVFWPAGFALLLWKAGVFKKGKATVKNISSDSRQEERMEKYRIVVEGRSVESISYLASAVGVSFDTAMRDLQRMVAEGRLGPRAYINYVDKTVVLDPAASGAADAARAASGPAYARPQNQNQNRPAGGAEGSNMVSRARASDGKKKAAVQEKNKGGEVRKRFEGADGLRMLLLILGIILAGLGGLTTLGVLTELSYRSFWRVVKDLIPSVAMAAGGAGCLWYRTFLKKRENRFKFYAAAVTGRDYIKIPELASKAGISERKCVKDLDAMLEKGLLPPSAYIDHGDGTLVLRAGAAPQKEEPVTEPEEDNEDRYKAILRQIRKLNDDIPDEGVSRRIDEIEDLTSRIFQAVQEKPEKEPQIKSFMSYYLPTTLKLLRSYADFERSGASGENISSAKAEIERILDTLVDGFRKQLDKLYESEAMDISSDIDVLETMLRRDGLTGDGSDFRVQRGGK